MINTVLFIHTSLKFLKRTINANILN